MAQILMAMCVCCAAVGTAAAALPVELGFEYGNGYTLKRLSEIEGSHVLDSCDDQSVYATADHSPMPGYSGKHGYPGSFTSVGSYFFQVKTRVESDDWYDIAVEKTANGQPTEGVSLEEGKSLYVDFLANLTTFDDDPTISFQQTLQAANSLNAIRLVARPGCLVSIDRNFYLYRHEALDRNDEPIATNWCVVAADRTSASPVRRMWELTHVDGSAFPANEDGFEYPFNVVHVCAHLGISPSRIYDSSTPIWMEALYKMPTVRVEGIDPERGVITGRVVPAEGTRIVAPPLERAFGFDQVIDFGKSARYDKEWGHAMQNKEEGFALDLSDYQRSNGLFRVAYPKWIIDCRDDGQYEDTFFKIHLRDYEQNLW